MTEESIQKVFLKPLYVWLYSNTIQYNKKMIMLDYAQWRKIWKGKSVLAGNTRKHTSIRLVSVCVASVADHHLPVVFVASAQPLSEAVRLTQHLESVLQGSGWEWAMWLCNQPVESVISHIQWIFIFSPPLILFSSACRRKLYSARQLPCIILSKNSLKDPDSQWCENVWLISSVYLPLL